MSDELRVMSKSKCYIKDYRVLRFVRSMMIMVIMIRMRIEIFLSSLSFRSVLTSSVGGGVTSSDKACLPQIRESLSGCRRRVLLSYKLPVACFQFPGKDKSEMAGKWFS
jgi:hypothetical protein